jgi:hypothetical protein
MSTDLGNKQKKNETKNKIILPLDPSHTEQSFLLSSRTRPNAMSRSRLLFRESHTSTRHLNLHSSHFYIRPFHFLQTLHKTRKTAKLNTGQAATFSSGCPAIPNIKHICPYTFSVYSSLFTDQTSLHTDQRKMLICRTLQI